MAEELYSDRYARLETTELFRMTRSDAIFVLLASRLIHRGKRQFYKAAEMADEIEELIRRQERLRRS